MRKLLLAFLIACASVLAQEGMPVLTKRVTDLTNTLTQEQAGNLSLLLHKFEDTTSSQLAVLIIPTLNGSPIEEYAYSVAQNNKIGQVKKDNGVLLLVAKDDRQVRIEVGYGLEGALPDATCSYIIRHEIIPFFKDKDYYAGISAGVTAIIKATAGEYTVDPSERKGKRTGKKTFNIIIFIIVALLSFVFRGRRRRGIYYGGGFGGFGGGGSGFGGGGGFGGFSGGGGSFGGGGASGSW